MSKHNKVNPGQYHVGGRLTPDEMARERMKQQRPASAVANARGGKAADARDANVHEGVKRGREGHLRGSAKAPPAAKARTAGRRA